MASEDGDLLKSLWVSDLRRDRRREGRYWPRANVTENDPALLWLYYIPLAAVEQAFKNLKGYLAIRPVFHQDERRIEAHIFIAFLAYCLQLTLQRRLHAR
jgi:hypothetical protein